MAKNPELKQMEQALARAIETAGGAAALARKLDITVQAVCEWKRCPPLRVVAVEAATGGAVTAAELRPDLFARKAA